MLLQQEYVGQLIGIARRRLKQAVLSRVRSLRLSPQQFWLLVSLHERGGAPLVELARRQQMDAPTATRLVQALRQRSLLRVRADKGDRRLAHVELSAAGTALLPRLLPIAQQVRASVISALDKREVEALRALLGKVIAGLEQFGNEGRALAGPPRKQRARSVAAEARGAR